MEGLPAVLLVPSMLVLVLILVLMLLCGCQAPAPPDASQPVSEEDTFFRDAGSASGLDFLHSNGGSGEFFFPELLGSGAAFLDFDNDGDLDIYLVQSGHLGLDPAVDPRSVRQASGEFDRLYRNEFSAEAGVPVFTDITEASGLCALGYGMGVATGDVDNDGWPDLYVTNWGANQLWHNGGDGTFADITEVSGAGDERWSVSAAFVDFDRDGWLDLYVVNYVEFAKENHVPCRAVSTVRDYCSPSSFTPTPDRLLRNLGVDANGQVRFEDVSDRTGIAGQARRGLGVVTIDVDGDGWLDLYVANDQEVNILWVNRDGASFEDEAILRGCAVNLGGLEEASMGAAAADLDYDGDEDLFLSHLDNETNTFYLNEGDGFFVDRSQALRLAAASLPYTGFGTTFFDYDNDGWLDVAVANGAVRRRESLAAVDPYRQSNQLFHNGGAENSGFREVPAEQAGTAFAVAEVSRGLAVGDVDNDGDPDLLISNNAGPARLLLNTVGQERPWAGLRLVGTDGSRDMLGAMVEVMFTDGSSRLLRVRTDSSYASARDPRLLLAIPEGRDIKNLLVTWPDGQREEFPPPPHGSYTALLEGSGHLAEGS
jgi:hypothetical protein